MEKLLACAVCFLGIAAAPVHADDEPPGRVGRIAHVQGTLHHAPDDSAGEWTEIGHNYPVAQGDNLRVLRDGRAEVDYGGGQFRLAGETNLHVSRLDERQLALFIAAGRVIIRVRVLEADDAVRIDTPATQIALRRAGLYRIDVAPDSPHTTVVVREGEAELATPGGDVQVLPGQTASLTGVAGEQADVRPGGGIDGFDAWSATRDRVYEEPRQNAYVSRQMIGNADLDRYGTWQTYADYGPVWFPSGVTPEWAPYRYGHWTWVSGWGYTWVDDAPWGYAPFHYGRWAHIGGRWGWCPGTYVVRPLWAPALVAWYGGAGWSHGFHGGSVYGWVPLGWREPFVPWWGRCDERCRTRHNRPHGINVAETHDRLPTRYANWNVPGGLTAVPVAALAAGKPVAINRVHAASNVAFAPSLLTRPPAIKPIAPVRPALRTDAASPLPASRIQRALAPAPPDHGRGRSVRFAPPASLPPAGSVERPLNAVPVPQVAAPQAAPAARQIVAPRTVQPPPQAVAPRTVPAVPQAIAPRTVPAVPQAIAPRTVPAVPQAVAPRVTRAPQPAPALSAMPQAAAALPAPRVPAIVPTAPVHPATPAPVTRAAPAPAPAPNAAVPTPAVRGAVSPTRPAARPN